MYFISNNVSIVNDFFIYIFSQQNLINSAPKAGSSNFDHGCIETESHYGSHLWQSQYGTNYYLELSLISSLQFTLHIIKSPISCLIITAWRTTVLQWKGSYFIKHYRPHWGVKRNRDLINVSTSKPSVSIVPFPPPLSSHVSGKIWRFCSWLGSSTFQFVKSLVI